MAEDFLHDGDIFAVFQQMSSKGVAQRMRRSIFLDTGLAQGLFEYPLHQVGGDMTILARKEPAATVTMIPVVSQQKFGHMIGQGDGAVFPSFAAAYPEQLPAGVNICNTQLHPFGVAQATGVDYGERHLHHRFSDPL